MKKKKENEEGEEDYDYKVKFEKIKIFKLNLKKIKREMKFKMINSSEDAQFFSQELG